MSDFDIVAVGFALGWALGCLTLVAMVAWKYRK